MRFNPVTRQVAAAKLLLHKPDVNLQNGEFVTFPNGDIACYLDVQAPGGSGKKQTVRLGLVEFRSTDGGQTFREVGKLGVIDGIEYGYAFEAATQGRTTWMLVMTFSNLAGGKSITASRPAAGSVNVIRSDNSGKEWHFVNDLTREFGHNPINESSLLPYGDGFIVTTRGYNNRQWLQRTDRQFKLQRQVDLTAAYPDISSYLARPRLFARDGAFYVMGRNYTGPVRSQPVPAAARPPKRANRRAHR